MIKHSKEEILLIKNDTVSRFFSEEGGTMKHKAFTLLEILIAIIIVGIIAGIILLNSGASTSKAEQTACLGNRESFEHAYSLYKMGMTNPMTLESFIKTDDKDALKYMDKLGKCPSGGVYSVSEDTATGRYHVVCSIHKDVIVASSGGTGGGSSGGGNIIPGTTDFGGTGIVANDDWSKAVIDEHNIKIIAGQKFKIGDKYYVAVITRNIWYTGSSDPGVNTGYWTYANNEGVVKATGVSVSWSNVSTGDTFSRGDIMYYNGSYYICQQTTFSVQKTSDYQNTPTARPDAWFKL